MSNTLTKEDVNKLQERLDKINDEIEYGIKFGFEGVEELAELIREQTLLEFRIYGYEINYYLPNFPCRKEIFNPNIN